MASSPLLSNISSASGGKNMPRNALGKRSVMESLERRTFLSAGSILSTFGTGGQVNVTAPPVLAEATQPDGKIVVLSNDNTLRRFDADGGLDPGFGDQGVATPSFANSVVSCSGLAVQPNGAIVLVGIVNVLGSGSAAAVMRLTSTGAVDTSFGGGAGYVQTLDSSGRGRTVAVQSNGKIVVGIESTVPDFVRLNSDGSTDGTFDFNGGAMSGVSLLTMGIDGQGRIDVQGQSASFGGPFILRIEPDGSTDPSFSGGVRTLSDISQPGRIVVQPNGGVLVPVTSPYTDTLGVVRLTPTLDPDQSFGPNGMASSLLQPLSGPAIYGAALQPDGSILVAGTTPAGQQSAIVMARFLPGGQSDTTFGTAGSAGGAFDGALDFDAVTYTSDNRIVIVADGGGTLGLEAFVGKSRTGTVSGTVFNDRNGDGILQSGEAGLAGRTEFVDYNGNHNPDPGEPTAISDSAGHYTIPNVATGNWLVWSIQPAGWKRAGINNLFSIVASKTTTLNLGSTPINNAMPFDPSFGSGGIALVIGEGSTSAIARQADGKIVVTNAFGVARFTAAGAVDSTFGSKGQVDLPQTFIPDRAAVLPNGQIIVTGEQAINQNGSHRALAVMRLNTNGAVDNTFGTQGMLITAVSDAEGGSVILVRPDGSFVVEDKYVSSGEKNAIVRFTSAGKVDSTFGVGGYLRTTSLGSMTLQTDGKILLAGKILDAKTSTPVAILTRLLANGSLDAGFGTGGSVTLSPPPGFPESFWDAALVTADGKIIVGGDFGGQAVIARYTAVGTLDSTFGSGGRAVIKDLFAFSYISSVKALALTASGEIVAIGDGNYTATGDSELSVSLFTSSGQPDVHFAQSGHAWWGISDGQDKLSDGLLQPDNKVLILSNTGMMARFVLPGTTPAPASIGGTVYNDANGNGQRNTGEAALSGRKVFIDKNKNGIADAGEPTATTNSSGAFTFSGLAAGTYRIVEVLPPGWRRTSPAVGYYDVTITAGQIVSGKDFAQTTRALISGTVFKDANANGVKDSTEAALSGWVVYLDTNNNGKLDAGEQSFTTGSDGKFSFIVPAGTYHLREVLKTGFKRTAPSTGVYTITLSSGQSTTGKNFGDK
jgi:uncharacterized delta-60 repeat protein